MGKRALQKHGRHIALLALIGAASWYVSAYFAQLMIIQGQSMSPSYHGWQPVILCKRFKGLEAGDVVAFECGALDALLVKRIVGVPGDRVQIRGGVLYVNGRPDARALPNGPRGGIPYPGIAEDEIKLSEDEYFVMGDNYAHSKDSRHREIGCVRERDIVGRVLPQAGWQGAP